jgi:HK97 gp10 family phage protein
MSAFTVKVPPGELAKAIREIKAWDGRMRLRMEGALRKGTRMVRREAAQRVPRHTGRLRKSIKTRFSSVRLEGQVYSNEPHAHLVEFGARAVIVRTKRKKALRFPFTGGYRYSKVVVVPKRVGKPFMKTAYEYVEPTIIQDAKKALRGT